MGIPTWLLIGGGIAAWLLLRKKAAPVVVPAVENGQSLAENAKNAAAGVPGGYTLRKGAITGEEICLDVTGKMVAMSNCKPTAAGGCGTLGCVGMGSLGTGGLGSLG
jgi:hypothetical protein